MGATSNSFVADVTPTVDVEQLEYDVTDENVCFSNEMIFHMNLAARIMTGLATLPHIPAPFTSGARVAAWLMADDGPIQMHGQACVHRECVHMYYEMYVRLEQLFHAPATVATTYEAARMVLQLGMHLLQDDTMVERVVATIRAMDEAVAQRSSFHFGFVDHQCVPLFSRGNVDPDGVPNLYV
jgi:hypothetical protein